MVGFQGGGIIICIYYIYIINIYLLLYFYTVCFNLKYNKVPSSEPSWLCLLLEHIWTHGNEVDVCAASGADAPGATRTLWNDQDAGALHWLRRKFISH